MTELNLETSLAYNVERAVRRFFWFEFGKPDGENPAADITINEAGEVIEGVSAMDFEHPLFLEEYFDGTPWFKAAGNPYIDHSFRRLLLTIYNAQFTLYKGEQDEHA